ncbi:MAG: alpha/beta hydrolase [Ruminococcaceae bacterium]|nr:alpha/beta hydrolase [Oscillospiraceae bacterium]
MEPKLMTSLSGEPITNTDLWEKFRREELLELLTHYAYGRCPDNIPVNLSFETVEEKEVGGTDYKRIAINCDGYVFPIRLFLPKTEEPAPCVLYFMHYLQESESDIDNEPNCLFIPIADLCAKGVAVAVLYYTDIYPDHRNLRTYDIGLFAHYGPTPDKRKPSDWAAVSAWAWAASRVADYLVTDPRIDANNLAVAGHSRGGKAALWAGANDTRFSLIISNSSGCMGAAMLRGKTGEHIDFISTHTDWLCQKQWTYADNEEMFPVDQHMLLALIAPRLLYVQSSALDDWADPASERRACVLASEAYELYGKKGVVLPEDVQPDTPYHEGCIGYHMSVGEHKIRACDWEMFLQFWKKHTEGNV